MSTNLRGALKGNGNELRNIKPELLTADPGGLGGTDEGRWWWRTDLDRLVIWDGGVPRRMRDESVPIVSADITDGTITDADVNAANKDGTSATYSLRRIGFDAATKAMKGTAKLSEIAANNPNAGDIDLQGYRIVNTLDPLLAADAATKGYVDAAIQGLKGKPSVRLATNAALAAWTAAASQLTANANGALTVDSVAAANGDRILVKNEGTSARNGVYVVTNAGSAGTPWVIDRAADADTFPELVSAYVWVEAGTQNQDSGWLSTVDQGGTLNTTSIPWTQFSGAGMITAGAGLTKSGNSIDVIAADGSITVAADSIAVGNVPIAKGGTGATTAATARGNLAVPLMYTQLIGDGSATSFTIAAASFSFSNLNGNYIVQIQDVSGAGTACPIIDADITINRSTGDVMIAFSSAPAASQYRVIVMGV